MLIIGIKYYCIIGGHQSWANPGEKKAGQVPADPHLGKYLSCSAKTTFYGFFRKFKSGQQQREHLEKYFSWQPPSTPCRILIIFWQDRSEILLTIIKLKRYQSAKTNVVFKHPLLSSYNLKAKFQIYQKTEPCEKDYDEHGRVHGVIHLKFLKEQFISVYFLFNEKLMLQNQSSCTILQL